MFPRNQEPPLVTVKNRTPDKIPQTGRKNKKQLEAPQLKHHHQHKLVKLETDKRPEQENTITGVAEPLL